MSRTSADAKMQTFHSVSPRHNEATAFTALAWISTLQWSVQSLPGIYNAVANLKPSIKRIDEFLTAPINGTQSRGPGGPGGPGRPLDLEALEGVEGMEQEMSQMSQMSMSNMSNGHTVHNVHRHDTPRPWRAEPWLETGTRVAAPMAVVSRNAVEVSNATFGYRSGTDTSWNGLFETSVLQKLNFQVKAGSFVMIAGAVGSGKSTLLASLACARPALHGFCETKGRRAYVPQKPFLLNGSVKENIVFGLPLDDERYNSALEMSALPDDLKTLTSGDATLVGESGVRTLGMQSHASFWSKCAINIERCERERSDIIISLYYMFSFNFSCARCSFPVVRRLVWPWLVPSMPTLTSFV